MVISMKIKAIARQQFLSKKEDVVAKAIRKAKQEKYNDLFGFNDYLENAKNQLHI